MKRRLRHWKGLLLAALGVALACRRDSSEQARTLFTARALGYLHLERDELAEAGAEFRKVVALSPREAFGYAGLGSVALRGGDLANAEQQIRRALALDSSDTQSGLLLAELYRRTGRGDSARVRLSRLASSPSPDPRVLQLLAQLVRPASDPDHALYLPTLERLAALLPANPVVKLELAEALLNQQQGDSALQQLEQFRQLPPALPGTAASLLERAIRSLQRDRVAEAREELTQLRTQLELTSSYQAARQAIQGPAGPEGGLAALTFSSRHAMLQRLGQDDQAVQEIIRFEDATPILHLPGGATAAEEAVPAVGDYDGDGVDDLFLPGPRATLLRSRPGGLADQSERSGIRFEFPATAAAFGDYDNDGYLDLYSSGGTGPGQLFHNEGRGTYRDVTRAAGLAAAPAARKALFADLDHDGDLDLLLLDTGGIRFYRNNLDGSFRDVTASSGLQGRPASDAEFGDLDHDGLTDLLVAAPEATALLLNQRQGRFQLAAGAGGLGLPGAAVLALADYDNDGWLDLFLAGARPALYRNSTGRFVPDSRSARLMAGLDSLEVRAALFLDYDNDGFLDLAVAGEPRNGGTRAVRLFRNDGTGRLLDRSSILPAFPGPAHAITAWDEDQDGDLDLLVGGPQGPRLLLNSGGNLNLYLNVALKGLRTGSGKNNVFGIGARIELRAGESYQSAMVTGRTSHFGLGRHLKADVLRIVWPNGVPQIVYLPGSDQDVLEEQLLKGSCAFVYAWDGHAFRFVTDLMWRSALGMPVGIMGTGATAFAPAQASREYVRLRGEQLVPKDGRYVLQLTEELWETAYLDELKLLVVDHPDSVEVFVNERFVPPSAETPLKLYRVVHASPPVAATDGDGNDWLPALRARDDLLVSNLTPAAYQGLVAPHDLILELGEQVQQGHALLGLTGWIFPTDASINVALSQRADLPAQVPELAVRDTAGRWKTVLPDLGFPSGKNKTVLADLSGSFPTADHRVRIRTNLQIYWDQAFVAGEAPDAPVTVTTLSALSADLHARGFSRSYRKGGRFGPHWFDYDSVVTAPRWRPIEGALTRFGDVLRLLESSDDRYVIMGPGDEATVQFATERVPALPAGWKRDFLIYSDGWIKDADLNTAFGGTVEPLPYHAIRQYPYAPGDSFPADSGHRNYRASYNTRRVTRQ